MIMNVIEFVMCMYMTVVSKYVVFGPSTVAVIGVLCCLDYVFQ